MQIIVLELFMDVGASSSFTVEPADGDLMGQPPRSPSDPFFDRPMMTMIAAGAASLLTCVLAAFFYATEVSALPGGLLFQSGVCSSQPSKDWTSMLRTPSGKWITEAA
jgi:magnesium-transporting ATPase (P-type)